MASDAGSVWLGLGSNMQYPVVQIKQAIKKLTKLENTKVVRVSSFYLNPPVGPAFQPWFVNAVVRIETRLSPMQLLRKLQHIEKSQKRKRRKRWGPRTLDIDILLYKNKIIKNKYLKVPHPHMLTRPFVMWPLYEITPDLVLPNHGKIETLLKDITKTDLIKYD